MITKYLQLQSNNQSWSSIQELILLIKDFVMSQVFKWNWHFSKSSNDVTYSQVFLAFINANSLIQKNMHPNDTEL